MRNISTNQRLFRPPLSPPTQGEKCFVTVVTINSSPLGAGKKLSQLSQTENRGQEIWKYR